MRAYRPSSMGGHGYDDEFERERLEKLETYADRARAGLPLFESVIQQVIIPARTFLDASTR